MRVLCPCGRKYDMVPPEPELQAGTLWYVVLVVAPNDPPPLPCCWQSAYQQGFEHRKQARKALSDAQDQKNKASRTWDS